MTDNGNQPRPTRTLTVKNFSVIKEAKLEFGKITVLIGPQSSGKSLLCKLAYFFQKVVVEQAEQSMREVRDYASFHAHVLSEFSPWFPAFGYEPNALITYEDGQYKLSLGRSHSVGAFEVELGRRGAGGGSIGLELSKEIEQCYNRVFRSLEQEKNSSSVIDFNHYAQKIKDDLRELQSSEADIYSYMTSTRSFYVTAQKAILATGQRSDPFTLRFAQDFSFDYQERVPKIGLESSLAKWIDEESNRILRGEVVKRGNSEIFLAVDGRELPLSYLSSGTQELLPLVMCLREFVALSCAVAKSLGLQQALHKRLFFVEEPEANIFPSTQYELVRIFTRMANEPILDASWLITTHSPYILTAFNDLIKAGQAAKARPEKTTEIEKIIPKQYWINEGDFAAYAFDGKDGILHPIMDGETGLINGDVLDDISENISDEFGQLLEIQYGD
jgi:hypothetical protein